MAVEQLDFRLPKSLYSCMAAFGVDDHGCASSDLGVSNIITEMMPATVDLVTNMELS